ncbi:MAG: hypothetical protein HYR68_01220 [Burkholderiales bacterium]|nr:hypothetical protein [Burkholderiales bacterium]MBI3727570.1 hypothetical protein [Burkholderiales bacterium]
MSKSEGRATAFRLGWCEQDTSIPVVLSSRQLADRRRHLIRLLIFL